MNKVEIGQVWDDVFGRYTYEVLFVTETNALLRARNYSGGWQPAERLIPLESLTTKGTGWGLL